jgi:hypothetical protein
MIELLRDAFPELRIRASTDRPSVDALEDESAFARPSIVTLETIFLNHISDDGVAGRALRRTRRGSDSMQQETPCDHVG